MTVKQLIRKLEHPPSDRIIEVRIEFADGSIYRESPDARPTYNFEWVNESLEDVV